MPQPYLMGHTDRDRRRLSLQASVLNPLTARFLRQAGVGEGMRVLDLGCGVGEVSLLLARLVGATGHVTGLDIDDASLEIARSRAKDQGFMQVVFEQSECLLYDSTVRYDAVVGRHILLHASDPLTVICKAASLSRPGGILGFQEYDFSYLLRAYPDLPLANRVMELEWDGPQRMETSGCVFSISSPKRVSTLRSILPNARSKGAQIACFMSGLPKQFAVCCHGWKHWVWPPQPR